MKYSGSNPHLKGKIGVVVRTEDNGGCIRGKVDVWFGDTSSEGTLLIEHVFAHECTSVPETQIPLGRI